MKRLSTFGLLLLVVTTLCKAQNVPSDARPVWETQSSTQDVLAERQIDDFMKEAKADWESFCKNTYVDKE